MRGAAASGATGVQPSAAWISSRDRTPLFVQAWRPPAPRAALVLVHGLADHSSRFAEPAGRLAEAGYATHALDYRAHGRSPGLRVHVGSFEEFRDDVRAALDVARRVDPGLPLFLLGHSQGGLIGLSLALREPRAVDGLVLTSPFLGVHPSLRPGLGLRLLARGLASFWPTRLFPNGVDPSFVSRDPAVVAAYRTDPLVSGAVSAGWYRAATATLDEVRTRAHDLAVPTLVHYAGDDRLVDAEATAAWIAGAPAGRVEAVRWPGLYHEVLNEPEKDQVMARILAWLDKQTPAVSSSA